MKINGHAHIFTLQSVLSQEAIRIMAGRLRKMGFRDFIVDAVADVLQQHLLRPEYLVEEELLKRFVTAMLRSPNLKQLSAQLPFGVLIQGNTDLLPTRALQAILDKLSSWIDGRDGPGKSPFDVLQTLRIAMQPSIPQVAGSMLKHLGPDDAIVALMMDIVARDEPVRDRRNFLNQIAGTQQAALAYPGRVFPFIAVNPTRPDHLDLMKDAIEKRGFAGVKLYPSLGYEIDTPFIHEVARYCERESVPITVHTTATGFAKDQPASLFAHPKHWMKVLEAFPDLRVCFAHCGGWGGFCKQDHNQIEWADMILGYMDRYPNVFADLSYHTEMMIKGGAAEHAYLTALSAMLTGPRAQRIVFGTDSWLLRLNIDDALYWNYFETKLTAAEMDTITRVAPSKFLGLPIDGAAMAPNIARFVRFLEQNAQRVGAEPAAWLRAASTQKWTVVPNSFAWARTNPAHVTTYNHFRSQIPGNLRGSGFDSCAGVRLHQLDYFTFGGSPPPDLIVSGNTRNLMSLAKKNGAEPEVGYDIPLIQARISEVLKEGKYSLSEMGGLLDSVYRFQAEA